MLPKDAGTFGFRSVDQLTFIEERIRQLSRSTSPQRLSKRNGKLESNGKMPWIPSSSNPTSPLASRRRPTSAMTQSLDHQHKNGGRRYTSPIDGINFKPDRKETLMKKRKKRNAKMSGSLDAN